MLSSRRRVAVDWAAVNAQLPTGRDPRSKAARHQLFKSFDPNGNGILSLAEVDRGLTQVLEISGIQSCRVVINRAFHAARDIAPPVAGFSNDYIDKNEFRVFLVYLAYYLQLFEYFDRIDTSGDLRVGPREFQASLPLLQRWGLQEANSWAANPGAAFRQMDKNGGGKVLFDEFADFALRRALGQGDLHGEDPEDRKDALDLLKGKAANLTSKGQGTPRAREMKFAAVGQGALSPRPPLGQQRWETSYARSFPVPDHGRFPSAVTAASPRQVEASRALGGGTTAAQFQDLGYRNGAQGLDRAALQMQLQSQLDRCNTGQLRKIQTMAGNVVVTPRPGGQPAVKRRMKALSVAINYTGMRGELRGCINDQETICNLWETVFKVPPESIQRLRDDDEKCMPTKRNIMEGLNWLAQDARPGDMLFFHYSGHGGQTQDRSGDERDGKDETLIPVDYQQSGMINDDVLRRTLVLPLKAGVSLMGLMDCCHSGTGMDLPFVAKLGDDGRSVTMSKKPKGCIQGSSPADVVMISGCKDSQTSADANIGSDFSGAMTKAFENALSRQPNGSFHKILILMRKFLKAGQYTQVPQMSSERPVDLSDPFIRGPGSAKPKGSRVKKQTGTAPRRKALSVAINYIGHKRGTLRGCINDQQTVVSLWQRQFGVSENAIRTLRDDDPDSMPTKANIVEAMRWLVEDARPGDELYYHYSGHGGQQKDTSGDEHDGKDETMIPCDYQSSGMISDDELRDLLVLPLPEGASLFGLLDCCHSGTGMDLPFVVKMQDDRSITLSKKSSKYIRGSSAADVVMLSGCKDTQTSADAHIGAEFSGAMTAAFQDCITKRPTLSYHHLLQNMRRYLKKGKYVQVPQMSSERMLDLSESVVPPR